MNNNSKTKGNLNVQTKYYSFNECVTYDYLPGLRGKNGYQMLKMYNKAVEKNNPTILELGTHKGKSTTVFLRAC